MDKLITYVGLDVHKDTIAVAVAEAGKRGEVRDRGTIANTPAALKALAAKLARPGSELRFCYEAGPCGYGIHRQLTRAGHECIVVAPSLIPRKPGDRIKTDRRDAINLAKLHRAGELTAVWVPDAAHEAIRDLVRARQAAVRTLRQARQQLSGFLLRHGHHYHRPAWTLMHRRWMAGLKFEHARSHRVGGQHRGRGSGRGSTRSSGSPYRGDAAGLVAGASGARIASAARNRAGRGGDVDRRTRRHHPLRQSPATDGVPRSGSLGALQWRQATPRRHHQGGQWRGQANTDRGGLVLSVSGSHQPRAIVETGGSRQADPRHRLEGARATVPPLSQTRPGGKATHSGHGRDRSRTGGLCLGDRQKRDSARRCADIHGGHHDKEVIADSTIQS